MIDHTDAEIFEAAIKKVPQMYLEALLETRVQVVFNARDENDVMINRRYIYDVLLKKVFSEDMLTYEWVLSEIYKSKFELIPPNN